MKRIVTVIAVILAFVSCGDVVRTGRSPMFLTIDLLQAAKGDKPTAPAANRNANLGI